MRRSRPDQPQLPAHPAASRGRAILRKLRAQSRTRQNPLGPRVFEQEGQPFGRIVRIERQVGGASFQRGQNGHNHLDRTLQADGDDVLGADAVGDQLPGQLIGAGVEFGIGPLPILEEQRNVVRRLADLLLEQVSTSVA